MLREILEHCRLHGVWVVTVLFFRSNHDIHCALDSNVVYSNNARLSSAKTQGDRVAESKCYEKVVVTQKLDRVGPLACLRGGHRSWRLSDRYRTHIVCWVAHARVGPTCAFQRGFTEPLWCFPDAEFEVELVVARYALAVDRSM